MSVQNVGRRKTKMCYNILCDIPFTPPRLGANTASPPYAPITSGRGITDRQFLRTFWGAKSLGTRFQKAMLVFWVDARGSAFIIVSRLLSVDALLCIAIALMVRKQC